jgi:hypothetical protein
VLLEPSDRCAGDRWPRRTGFGGDGETVQEYRRVGEFGYAPGVVTHRDEALGDVDQRRNHLLRPQPHAGVRPRQQQRRGLAVDEVDAEVGAQARDVAAAVVEAEEEPPGQPGQRRRPDECAVQLGDDSADVREAALPAGQR